ncbi:DUF1127 domain-containing protein [Rhizobium halophytocola]|uniref:Uncharacterized protein YjiS (DUF1127 family) n=1 Tax=Rhizobium halophytocola TaxID=735519 RepID=A0ABS4DZC3_9HYPH|nr:DUF1127 domain-containing protein [Rhizobium halophytocola]MBP1851035.1 uncharacterized protein YjiS (DUF1127 family) [Rhizobium halophytocola]
MRKHDEYLATIDTIYPDAFTRETLVYVRDELLPARQRPNYRTGLVGMFDRLVMWHLTRQGRKQLRDLDDALLADIGISKLRARSEVARSRLLL